jgi:hypothetical protein
MRTTIALAVSAALVLMATPKEAASITYTFYGITQNDVTGVSKAIGEAQLSVDVVDAGAGQILFNFFNVGSGPSSITQIYFEDASSLLNYDSIINGPSGVDFERYAPQPNLPSGNTATPAFEATAGLSFTSRLPRPANGVNPGETVGILFDGDFNSAIDALNSGDLRIGLHVQSFAAGVSESFVNSPPIALPLPGTLVLFGTGSLVAVIAALRRRRRKP